MPTINFKIKSLNLPKEDFTIPLEINEGEIEAMILEGATKLSMVCNAQCPIRLSITELTILLALIPDNNHWGINLQSKIERDINKLGFNHFLNLRNLLEANKDILDEVEIQRPEWLRDYDEEWVEE